MIAPSPSRRRFLSIAVGACAIAALPGTGAATVPDIVRWHGTAMGAEAQMLLPAGQADRLIPVVMAEVDRLEGIFSLYRADSVLAELNRTGSITAPPPEMVDLLSRAASFSSRSNGAFDITVQSLWMLYAEHFRSDNADPRGPSADRLHDALKHVDWSAMSISPQRISLGRPGMAITLNGIAQGYVTDRVATLLRAEGFDRVLIDLGETRALGPHPDGRPWQIGFASHPAIGLHDGAIATSSGAGMRFTGANTATHILDPRTGAAVGQWVSATVEAPTATEADALSTALTLMTEDQARALLTISTARRAWLVRDDGTVLTLEKTV